MNLDLFRQYAEKFILYLQNEKHVSSCTLTSYKSDLFQFCSFWQTYQETKGCVLDVQKILSHYERWLFNQRLSSSTIARKCSCLASLNRFFRKLGVTETIVLQRPITAPKTPVFIQLQKLIALFDDIQNEQLPTKYPYRDRAVIELLYATGMRCSELASLCIDQINVQERSILVKGSKSRHVFFGTQAYEKIERYLKYERGAALQQEPLFVSYRNTPLTARSIQRICTMFGAFLPEKKKITPMLLRNSFATHLIVQGADSLFIKELLGYTTDSSVEKYRRKK